MLQKKNNSKKKEFFLFRMVSVKNWLIMVESLLFKGAGARAGVGAGDKKTRSRSKTNRLLNTGHETRQELETGDKRREIWERRRRETGIVRQETQDMRCDIRQEACDRSHETCQKTWDVRHWTGKIKQEAWERRVFQNLVWSYEIPYVPQFSLLWTSKVNKPLLYL